MSDERMCVACLTPGGTGAIATLALRGDTAWATISELFQTMSGGLLPSTIPESGTVIPGKFGDGIADEVVLTVKQTRPPPWLEVHCHGGMAVVDALLEQLKERGANVVSWSEFLGVPEQGWRAAIFAEVAQARTVRTAAILLDQVNGAFERAIESICQHLQSGNATMARAEIDELLGFAEMGQHLVKPWRVVIAGAPNVGKSSLINALAGYTRSLVAPTAGTTRDLVTLEVAMDGWPVELVDSAGLREDAAPLEREGSALARQAMAAAHLILWVLDASTAPVWPEQIDENRTLFVINKIDLAPAWEIAREGLAKQVSARTGEGIAAMSQAISQRLVPNPPPAGRGIPVLNSQVDILQAARRCLDSGSSELALASLLAAEKSGQDGKFDQIGKGAW